MRKNGIVPLASPADGQGFGSSHQAPCPLIQHPCQQLESSCDGINLTHIYESVSLPSITYTIETFIL